MFDYTGTPIWLMIRYNLRLWIIIITVKATVDPKIFSTLSPEQERTKKP
jgi:hypothetical protein